MTEIFGRVARVLAYRAVAGTPGGFVASNPQFFDQLPNGIVIQKLRIMAEVEKHIDKEPNTCKITIINCNESTQTFLSQKPLIVRLEAGYNDEFRHLFVGDVRVAYTEFKNASVQTHLELADGDRAFRYAQVDQSFRKGSSVIQALRVCAQSFGVRLDPKLEVTPELQAQFASGRTLQGDTQRELTELLAPYGYKWSFQDGRLLILKDNETRADEAILVSEETGMVDSPTFHTPDKPNKPTQVKVKMKLRPQITPGVRIVVRSRGINSGVFRVNKANHDLDTRDGPFDTVVEGTAAS